MSEKYLIRTFWSPDKQHLVTVHVSDEGIIALQDDNGTVWEAASENLDVLNWQYLPDLCIETR